MNERQGTRGPFSRVLTCLSREVGTPIVSRRMHARIHAILVHSDMHAHNIHVRIICESVFVRETDWLAAVQRRLRERWLNIKEGKRQKAIGCGARGMKRGTEVARDTAANRERETILLGVCISSFSSGSLLFVDRTTGVSRLNVDTTSCYERLPRWLFKVGIHDTLGLARSCIKDSAGNGVVRARVRLVHPETFDRSLCAVYRSASGSLIFLFFFFLFYFSLPLLLLSTLRRYTPTRRFVLSRTLK